MRLRSLLFVPGDRPERFGKAAATGADCLILDLEDSVAADRKPVARAAVADRLSARPDGPLVFVRVNPLDTAACADDLAALAGHAPDGVLLPKAEGAGSVAELHARLAADGLGDIPILPIATETPAAIFQLGSYCEVKQHLLGLTWGAEDLPAAIGAATSRETNGSYTPPYELARSLTLFAAHAAGVPAIDTVFPAFRDIDGLRAYVSRAARDGFAGMMAIHPSQVAIINAGFTPDVATVERARVIVAAFDADPGAGALQMEGRMVDAPHLKQARAILARAGNQE